MSTNDAAQNEEFLLALCDYSHDYDGAVYEEKTCYCGLYRCGDTYFVRRSFRETHDDRVVARRTEDIPVKPEDLDLSRAKFSAVYCHGVKDNHWISVYRVHRDADVPAEHTVRDLIQK